MRSSPTTTTAGQPIDGEPTLTYQPHVDICDTGGGVTIIADIPGAGADSIDVSFEDGVLTVHATVSPRDLAGRVLRQEYGIGDYRRSFRLGDGFDGAPGITKPVADKAGVTYETITSMKAVEQLDLLDANRTIVLSRTDAGVLDLDVVALP